MSQIQKILQRAKELGIKDNLFFVATLSDYKQIRDNMKKIGRELEKQGVMKNERANPLLSEFNSCAMTSANIAEKLMKMLGMQVEKKKSERAAIDDKEQKKCPDFEMLSPEKIKAWCKHYDIDPNDYSKTFLFRALRKRWEFEYGE